VIVGGPWGVKAEGGGSHLGTCQMDRVARRQNKLVSLGKT